MKLIFSLERANSYSNKNNSCYPTFDLVKFWLKLVKYCSSISIYSSKNNYATLPYWL